MEQPNRSEIQAEMWLNDVETIKVFADTLRLEVIRLMAEPATVKDVAAKLDIPAAKLYYHINLLEKHGLIQVVAHNIEGNLVEKIYQVTARQFKLVNPLVSGAVPDESAAAIFASMLQTTQREFSRAYANRDPQEGSPPRHPFFSQKSFRLTDAQLSALHAKLDSLIQEVTALGSANNDLPEEQQYALTLVFYKQATQGETT